MDRVSHLITSLKESGNNFVGKARILDTPMGRVTRELLDEGIKLGVSSRGLGSIKEQNGCKVVCDDFILATAADIVADPSAPDAFVNGIMEGKEWIWSGSGVSEQRLETIKDRINSASRTQLAERNVSAFDAFLKSL